MHAVSNLSSKSDYSEDKHFALIYCIGFLIDKQSSHVGHLTVTPGNRSQTRFLLNRKVIIQHLCAHCSGWSNLAHPFTSLSWACERNSSHFPDSLWSITAWGTGS